MIDFNNVTDIAIPQGNVVKIHETDSGRVLWQKKQKVLSGHWEITPYNNEGNPFSSAIIRSHLNDTGNELLIFGHDELIEGSRGYCYYNPITEAFSQIQYLDYAYDGEEAHTWKAYDHSIDTNSKVWCIVGDEKFYCSTFADNIVRDSLTFNACCCSWSNTLKRFCLAGTKGSCLMDIYGNIYQNGLFAPTPISSTNRFCMTSGEGTNKFIAYRFYSNSSSNRDDAIAVSPDGYSWTYIQKISDDLPDSTSNNDRGIGVTWASHLNAYIAFIGNHSGYYVFKSPDGINWTQISTFSPDSGANSLLRAIDGAYSPELGVIAFFAGTSAYISYDAVNWVKITAQGIFSGYDSFSGEKFFIWAKSINAFIYGGHGNNIRKLIIDC